MNTPPIDPLEFEYVLEFVFARLRGTGVITDSDLAPVLLAASERYGTKARRDVFIARVIALQHLVDSGLLPARLHRAAKRSQPAWLDDSVVRLAARFPVTAQGTFDPALFLASIPPESGY